MSDIKDIKRAYFQGTYLPDPKALGSKISEIIKALNRVVQGIFTNITVSGTITQTSTTDSTNKDTGAIITDGGIGIEKSLSVGTNINLEKEVDHIIRVTDTSTNNTNGGAVTINSGTGIGSGSGGEIKINPLNGGTTGNGGRLIVLTGDGGSTSGSSGIIDIRTGSATAISGGITFVTGTSNSGGSTGNIVLRTGTTSVSGTTGDVQISTGQSASGQTGSIRLTPGTNPSTTVSATNYISKGVVYMPSSTSVASGGTINATKLIQGMITGTGATGNWQLPSTSDIVTAMGSASVGTFFDFVFNAVSMTAGNIATLVVGSGMTVQSSPAITGGGDLTINQSTQGVAVFRIIMTVTNTSCKIIRIA